MLQHMERFESWWGWLTEFRVDGPGLQAGSVLQGVVVPPLPYRIRVQIELLECVRPERIDAAVHGDLEGRAQLAPRPGRRRQPGPRLVEHRGAGSARSGPRPGWRPDCCAGATTGWSTRRSTPSAATCGRGTSADRMSSRCGRAPSPGPAPPCVHERAWRARSSGARRVRSSSGSTVPSSMVRAPCDRDGPPPQEAGGRAQGALGVRAGEGGRPPQHGHQVDALGLGEVAGDEGEGAPGQGEADVGVDPTSEELEVVAGDEQGADGDEGQQPRAHPGHAGQAEEHGAGQAGARRHPRGTRPGSGCAGGARGPRRGRGRRSRPPGRRRARWPRAGRGRCGGRATPRSRRRRGARRCTAGGGGSTSPATPPAGPRRRRAGYRVGATLPPPHDHAPAQAHEPEPHVDEPGVLPRRHRGRQRVAPVVLRDVRAEEAPDLEPRPPPGHATGQREDAARVQPPPSPPEPARGHVELEAGDGAPGLHHPGQLAERRRRVGHVAQEVGERQGVEGPVGEGQPLGLPGDELDAVSRLPGAPRSPARGPASPA